MDSRSINDAKNPQGGNDNHGYMADSPALAELDYGFVEITMYDRGPINKTTETMISNPIQDVGTVNDEPWNKSSVLRSFSTAGRIETVSKRVVNRPRPSGDDDLIDICIEDFYDETKRYLSSTRSFSVHPYGQSDIVRYLFNTEDLLEDDNGLDETQLAPWIMAVFVLLAFALGIVILAGTDGGQYSAPINITVNR